MSVVPYIVNGERTTVTTQRDFDKEGGINGNVVLIQNADMEQVAAFSQNSNVGYDLRVGQEYRDHRNQGRTTLAAGDEIDLLPNAAVIIETEELVHFPRKRLGLIVARVSLLQKGISNTSTKVDPGYYGRMLITVFNLGKQNVKLQRGDKLCTLLVYNIDPNANPYEGGPKHITGVGRRGWLQRARDIIESNAAVLTAVLLILNVLLIILQLI